MKSELTSKYSTYLRSKKQQNEGFTLIELLVVIGFIGVLAVITLPNILKQVGKARETELKNGVGTINRGQQAYHFERQAFAINVNVLGVTLPSQYNDDSTWSVITDETDTSNALPNIPGRWSVTHSYNTDFQIDGTRGYAGLITYSNGQYDQILCQSNIPVEYQDSKQLIIANNPPTVGSLQCEGATAEIK